MSFDYEKMVRTAFALNREDFSMLHLWIERQNAKENKAGEPWHYHYNFPRKNASIDVDVDADGYCVLTLHTNQETYSLGKSELSPNEFYKRGQQIKAIMDERHLNFCPHFTKEFQNELEKAEPGTVIILNTKRAVLCKKREENVLTFCNCFSGDTNALSIEMFRCSEPFVVDLNNENDIQDLFESAYNTRSLTANMRVCISSGHGAFALTDAERKIKENAVLNFHIGNINLRLCDFHGKKVWYDSGNKQIDRQTVCNLFGWAYLSLPEMKVERYLSPFVEDACQDAALIQDMQELIKQKQYTAAAMYAKDYAKNNKQIAVVNVEGIQKSKSNFDFVTFGFSETGIVKITYDENGVPNPGQEVSIADFEQFCKERYNKTNSEDKSSECFGNEYFSKTRSQGFDVSDNILYEDVAFLQTEYAPLVEKYRKTHPAEKRTKEELSKELAEHHATWKSPLIRPQKMDELAQSVRAFLETEVQNKSTQEPNTEQERDNT